MALDENLRVFSIASTVDRRCEYHSPRALTRKSANSLSESMFPNFYDSLVGLQLTTHYELVLFIGMLGLNLISSALRRAACA
jgi:hypothetical protein